MPVGLFSDKGRSQLEVAVHLRLLIRQIADKTDCTFLAVEELAQIIHELRDIPCWLQISGQLEKPNFIYIAKKI